MWGDAACSGERKLSRDAELTARFHVGCESVIQIANGLNVEDRFEGAVTFGEPLTGTVECPCGGVPGRNWTQGHAGIWRIPFAGEVIIAHAARAWRAYG